MRWASEPVFRVYCVRKFVCVVLCLSLSGVLFGEDLKIEIDRRQFYNDKKLEMIIYYIPFSALYRQRLDIDTVKSIYHVKIEARGDKNIFKFIQDIKNTEHTIIDDNYIDTRCVIEIFYDHEIIFSCGLSRFNVTINGRKITNDMRFYRILLNYLPKKYEYDIGFID